MRAVEELRVRLGTCDRYESDVRKEQDQVRAELLRKAGRQLLEWRLLQGLTADSAAMRCGLRLPDYMAAEDGVSSTRAHYFEALERLEPPSNLDGAA